MKVILKPKRFTSLIPPIPCSDEMRQHIDTIALSQDVSVAEVVRFAISRLFNEWEQLVVEATALTEQDKA